MMKPINVNEFPSSLKNRYGCGLQSKQNNEDARKCEIKKANAKKKVRHWCVYEGPLRTKS